MIIEVQNITVGYVKGIPILKDVSIKAEDKTITSVIGPNGAGKSTLLKAIYGFLKPWKGKILYKGENITGLNPFKMRERGIAYLIQGRSVFPAMTVNENLELGGWLIRGKKREMENSLREAYNKYPVLDEKKKMKARTLSGGQQRQLELVRNLMVKPGVLLLDEPSAGLAPKLAENIYKDIERLKEEGFTMVLVDQNVKKAVSLADYVYVLVFGRNKYEGPKEKFEADLKSLIQEWL